jgi:diguanylate cyclase (GGDEF)-like protein
MSMTAFPDVTADEVIRREGQARKGRLIRLLPPASNEPAMKAWAQSVAAAADRRVAELEARLAYLQDLAITDELTGALNRRGFIMELSRAIDAARRGGVPGVLLICDLNGFKSVNDRLGHGVGDEVLRQVGALLMHGVRRMDVAARLGGDEFAVLLIGADLPAAQRRIQFFVNGIAGISHSFETGFALPLSAAFGIAQLDGSEDEDVILHRADRSMYAEKRRQACATRRVCAKKPEAAG